MINNTSASFHSKNSAQSDAVEERMSHLSSNIFLRLPHTCVFVILFNQLLDMPHLTGGWIILAKEKCSLTQLQSILSKRLVRRDIFMSLKLFPRFSHLCLFLASWSSPPRIRGWLCFLSWLQLITAGSAVRWLNSFRDSD